MSHTPGPWHWVGNTLEPVDKDPKLSSVFSILDAEGGYGFLGSDSKQTHAEIDADRTLIAAAPDLLEALRRIANGYTKGMEPSDIEAQFREIAREAIAKATGDHA